MLFYMGVGILVGGVTGTILGTDLNYRFISQEN